MFVSFGDAAGAVTPRQRALVWPERGVFGVVDGDVDAVSLFAGALDAGLRTSTSVDDVAEVIDGVHHELRARDERATAAFALVVVEADALCFFAMGEVRSLVAGPGFVRRAPAPDLEALLGGDGAPRFLRAYVRAGDVVVLRCGTPLPRASRGADAGERVMAEIALRSAPSAAARSVVGAAQASAVVIRVDEEPRIR